MKPDRLNYQIWLIDWFDGNLDETRKLELNCFLDSNPDLKEEFEALAFTQLPPEKIHFTGKEKLFRSPSDLPLSQLEYLSIASLEKEITCEQMADLELNFNQNPENREVFESIQKIRLVPPKITFRNKNSLKKHPFGSRLLRYSVVSISAAAGIAILVLSYIFRPGFLSGNEKQTAEKTIETHANPEPFTVRTMVVHEKQEMPVIAAMKNTISPESEESMTSAEAVNNSSITAPGEQSFMPVNSNIFPVSSIAVPLLSEFGLVLRSDNLIASNNNFTISIPDDERSRLSRFIARTFRERLLKEDSFNDAPLRSYEIAEVGVEGINKLFGWDMALVRNNDESGEIKSIYFSSKILKFNAPVKKAELAR
jgi:hypothetical protein